MDLTSKERNKSIPAYEVGSVYWARDERIYFITYENGSNQLHQYNPEDKEDVVDFMSSEDINILSGDPTGRYLALNLPRQNPDKSFGDFGRNIIFDIQEKTDLQQFSGNSISQIVWSPSGE